MTNLAEKGSGCDGGSGLATALGLASARLRVSNLVLVSGGRGSRVKAVGGNNGQIDVTGTRLFLGPMAAVS